MKRSDQISLGRAYIFWIASLMFGLPLLSSFYLVQYTRDSSITVLVPYVGACAIAGVIFLAWSARKGNSRSDADIHDHPPLNSSEKQGSYALGYVALAFATLGLISYFLMKHFISLAYPSGAFSLPVVISGIVYLVSVSAAALTGLPFLLTRLFPSFRKALASHKNFAKIAVALGGAYFAIYLLLVNQIVITGFNTPPGNYVPSPAGIYPFAYVFTSGPPPSALLESAVYVPQILVQLNQYFNLVIMPFEIVLAIALATLVASSIIITYYIIEDSNHSCLTGASLSGIGGFFGFTATCPTCLAPTLVSVFFGGVSATVPSIYSHVSGIILPPLVSISALVVGIVLLDFQAKQTGHTFSSLATAIQNLARNHAPLRGNSVNERGEISESPEKEASTQ